MGTSRSPFTPKTARSEGEKPGIVSSPAIRSTSVVVWAAASARPASIRNVSRDRRSSSPTGGPSVSGDRTVGVVSEGGRGGAAERGPVPSSFSGPSKSSAEPARVGRGVSAIRPYSTSPRRSVSGSTDWSAGAIRMRTYRATEPSAATTRIRIWATVPSVATSAAMLCSSA